MKTAAAAVLLTLCVSAQKPGTAAATVIQRLTDPDAAAADAAMIDLIRGGPSSAPVLAQALAACKDAAFRARAERALAICSVDAPVVDGGPAAYFATLPVKAAVAAIEARGIPAYVSQTAGTFVCNHAFYVLQHELASRPGVRGGFVHVPFAPEQAAGTDRPSLPVETMAEALDALLRATLSHESDVRAVGGAIS